jgi:hypothetical protein
VAAVGSGLRGALFQHLSAGTNYRDCSPCSASAWLPDLATGKKADATDDAHTLITFPQASVPDDTRQGARLDPAVRIGALP